MSSLERSELITKIVALRKAMNLLGKLGIKGLVAGDIAYKTTQRPSPLAPVFYGISLRCAKIIVENYLAKKNT